MLYRKIQKYNMLGDSLSVELASKIVCLLHTPVGNPELVVVAGGTTEVEVGGRPIGDSLSC